MSLKIGVYSYNDKGFEKNCIQTISGIKISWEHLTAQITGKEYASYAEYERGVPGEPLNSEFKIDLTDPEIQQIVFLLSVKIWEKQRAAKIINDWVLEEDSRKPVLKSIDDLGGEIVDLEAYLKNVKRRR